MCLSHGHSQQEWKLLNQQLFTLTEETRCQCPIRTSAIIKLAKYELNLMMFITSILKKKKNQTCDVPVADELCYDDACSELNITQTKWKLQWSVWIVANIQEQPLIKQLALMENTRVHKRTAFTEASNMIWTEHFWDVSPLSLCTISFIFLYLHFKVSHIYVCARVCSSIHICLMQMILH